MQHVAPGCRLVRRDPRDSVPAVSAERPDEAAAIPRPASRRALWLRLALTGLLLVGGVGAASAFGKFDWRTFGATLRGFDLRFVGAALFMSTLQVGWQILRFWVAWRREERPPAWPLLSTTAVGQLLNSVTPLRSGDAFKVIRLSGLGVPASISIAALLGERLADTLALFVMALVSSATELSRFVARTAAAIPVLPAILVTVVLVAAAGWFFFGGGRRAAWAQRAEAAVRHFGARLGGFLASRRFALCLLVALVTWAFDAGTLFFAARAGGVPITPAHAMAAVFVLNLGVAVPLTVANVGVFEASLGVALAAQGVPLMQALSIATVHHAITLCGLLVCLLLLSLARLLFERSRH